MIIFQVGERNFHSLFFALKLHISFCLALEIKIKRRRFFIIVIAFLSHDLTRRVQYIWYKKEN